MHIRLISQLRRPALWLSGLVMLAGVAPVLAQSANYDSVAISGNPPAAASVTGRTAGSYALSNIVGSDTSGNLCTGFADTNPDHILTLESDVSTLTITVDSGQDTTLLIQGPTDNTVRCGQDTSRSDLDAQVTAQGWSAGTYRVWVGSFNQGERFSYTLKVQP